MSGRTGGAAGRKGEGKGTRGEWEEEDVDNLLGEVVLICFTRDLPGYVSIVLPIFIYYELVNSLEICLLRFLDFSFHFLVG